MITFGPFGLRMHELDTTGGMPPPLAGRWLAAGWLAGWLVHWKKNNIMILIAIYIYTSRRRVD